MDLGISGRRAVVCAASRGLGFGCAQALAREGVEVVLNARDAAALERAAEALRAETGVNVTAAAGDITTPEGREAVLSVAGKADILVNNAGGPPPGNWMDWDRSDFLAAIDANLLAPIAMMQALVPPMMERGWGRVVNITSQSVKAPIAALGLSNTARTGLTGFVAGTARQVAAKGVIINNLLPGSHDTDRLRSLDMNRSRELNLGLDEVRARRHAANPARRDGTVAEFGATCAFLCSQHVGYMVAQNILLDGGGINATI